MSAQVAVIVWNDLDGLAFHVSLVLIVSRCKTMSIAAIRVDLFLKDIADKPCRKPTMYEDLQTSLPRRDSERQRCDEPGSPELNENLERQSSHRSCGERTRCRQIAGCQSNNCS